MKIRKLTATFGKLHRQTLELKDGLNIIEAPNESGKSTWAGFLRAMLYGIDTKERDKKGFLAEKNRYQPWDGSTMEGSVQLLWEEKEITLRRSSKGISPMSQFQAVYTGTEEPVPGLTADNVGEALTGVAREAFERSAFVGQSSITVTGSAELERRISAIVSSGQEDVSYSETEQQLRDWKNRRQSNQKNGLIPRLGEERAAVTATLGRLERANQQAADARGQIQALEQELSCFEGQAKLHRDIAAARLRQRYDTSLAEVDQAQDNLDRVRRERNTNGVPPEASALRNMQGDLSYLNALDENIRLARREAENSPPVEDVTHPVFSGMGPQAARQRAESDALAVNIGDKNKVRRIVFSIIFGLVGAVVLITGLILSNPIPMICSVLPFAGTVLFLVQLRMEKQKITAILNSYNVTHGAAIVEQAEDYSKRLADAERARTDAAARIMALNRLESERESLSALLMEQVRVFAPEVTDLFGASAAISSALTFSEKERAAQLNLESAEKVLQVITAQGIPADIQLPADEPEYSEQEIATQISRIQFELSRQNELLAMAQGEMNTLGDPAALQAKLKDLEGQLQCRREEYDAIVMAMDALQQANATLQARMSPALNQRSGELFYRLTGGKYDQVSLTREFEALAAQHDDVTPRKLLALSKGTADQLYLAVRLAVCDLVLNGDDPAPLVLDDALVNFDDERLGLALDLLQDLAEHRQILLFTCQSRERLYLENKSDVYLTCLNSQ